MAKRITKRELFGFLQEIIAKERVYLLPKGKAERIVPRHGPELEDITPTDRVFLTSLLAKGWIEFRNGKCRPTNQGRRQTIRHFESLGDTDQ